MKKEFRLILSGRVYSGWSGGYAAGSIKAHYFHYKKNKKVFWYQHFRRAGFGRYIEEIKKNWEFLRKNPGKDNGGAFISDIGYFYEAGTGAVTWLFHLEKIIKHQEILSKEISYIPSFRRIYFENPTEHTGNWFLLSDLKKLKTPIKCKGSSGFKFLYNTRKMKNLNPQDHLLMNCFVSVFPKITKNDIYEPSQKELQDLHLKELLIKGLSDKGARFHESHVQNAILLDLLSKGYVFSKEGFIEKKETGEKGRYDFLVQKNNMYYAIETKVDDDINAAFQLQKYIDAIVEKGEIPRNRIKGVIICGRASKETQKKAKDKKFRVYEYKLDLNVPSLLEKL